MASNITVDTITKGSTTLNTDEIVDTSSNQICKAWVNFNMYTATIRDSYNVSSITDGSVGNFYINMTTSLSDTDYCVVASSQNHSTNSNTANNIHQVGPPTTSVFSLQHVENGSSYDGRYITAQVFSN